MGTHEYYSRVRVLLTRHFLMGTRGPRVLVEALTTNEGHDNLISEMKAMEVFNARYGRGE